MTNRMQSEISTYRPNDDPIVSLKSVSKWFGNVVAVSDVTLNIGPGITGLLGPNGAGKTTLLRMICGLYSTSEGEVQLLGSDPRSDHGIYGRIGIMTENESAYEFMTGLEFVRLSARLKDLRREETHLRAAIERVDMSFALDRKISTYSRGMRQRIRLAAALVGDPELLILDEPLNGADPNQRIRFQNILRETADEGRSVIISSHILEEVETVSDSVVLIVNGKLAAQGDFHAIRAALDDRPYHVKIECSDPKQLGGELAKLPAVQSIQFDPDGSMVVLTTNVAVLQLDLPVLAQRLGVRLTRVQPIDDSLESVFSYLVEG